jgi:hypothetical protein
MDDQRIKYQNYKIKKSFKIFDFLKILNKNKIKIILIVLIITILLFPTFYGQITGNFINKLITAFTNQISF